MERIAAFLLLTMSQAAVALEPSEGTATWSSQICPRQASPFQSAGCVPPSIAYGDTLEESIDFLGNIDVFLFVGVAGEPIVAQVVRVTGDWGPLIEICRPDGTHFALADASGSFPFFNVARLDEVLDATGCWTLLASDAGNNQTGDYTVGIERVGPPSSTATPICFGCDIPGQIGPEGDLDLFRFEGSSNQTIAAHAVMNGASLAVPRVELFRPDGSLGATASGVAPIPNTARLDITLDQSGTWTLLARERDNNGEDSYLVVLERIGACHPEGDLEITDLVVDSKEVYESCDEILAGPNVVVEAGGDVAMFAGGAVAFRNGFVVTVGGKVAAGGAPDGLPITYGTAIQGEIEPAGDIDTFVFQGTIDEVVVVSLSVPGQGGAEVELFRPDGSRLAVDSSDSTATINTTLDQSGTWTILAREWFNNEDADYTLSLQCVVSCP